MDAFVWYAAAAYDIVFDLGMATVAALSPVATLAREMTGWSYRHSRDLTGFEDGTENPNLYEAPGVALIDDGVPGAGGSVLLFQQWRHESSFAALPEKTQERVIGRTKLDSVELTGSAMPADSHVSRTKVLAADGEELPIFRRNVPAPTKNACIACSSKWAGLDGGPRDALTRHSTPLTGAYYFVPSNQALARFTTPDVD